MVWGPLQEAGNSRQTDRQKLQDWVKAIRREKLEQVWDRLQLSCKCHLYSASLVTVI